MKYRTYKVKKLFNGCVSVRNYVIYQCIREHRDLQIKFGKEYMIVPHEKLSKDLFQIHKSKFRSKYDGQTYELFDFLWQPNNNQGELFND